jgi:hypothetical protein
MNSKDCHCCHAVLIILSGFRHELSVLFSLTYTKMGVRNVIKDFSTLNMIFRLCLNVMLTTGLHAVSIMNGKIQICG